MKNYIGSARVCKSSNFFLMLTMSQGLLGFVEPNADPLYLPPDVDNRLLGISLSEVLSKSRYVSLADFHDILESGVLEKCGKERDLHEIKTYGLKTRRALYRDRACCLVNISGGQIEITSMDRKSFSGYAGTLNGEEDLIYVSVSASDAEIGAALREGFNRCTSSYSR